MILKTSDSMIVDSAWSHEETRSAFGVQFANNALVICACSPAIAISVVLTQHTQPLSLVILINRFSR